MRIDLSSNGVAVHVDQVSTPSLGNHTYVVNVGGKAVVIDPQRDIERFELPIGDADLVAVCETHVHNDYVSGGFWLADRHDATYVLPEGSGAPYPHTEMADGESIALGDWSLRAVDTPGHTFNHTSYVLVGPDGPRIAFTGGSMLVGAVGRSDLLGPDSTDALLTHQYESVRGLAKDLPSTSIVAPTHGAGSFCSASVIAGSTSTIEVERKANPACTAVTVDMFIGTQKAGYSLFPTYYSEMAPANLAPTALAPTTPIPTMTAIDAVGSGLEIVDVRSFGEYVNGHITGSIAAPPARTDATYVAWTLPWNSEIIVVGSQKAVADFRLSLSRLGWDNVVGQVSPESLRADGVELVTTGVATFADVLDAQPDVLLDVRDPVDHAAGMIPGALPIHVSVVARQDTDTTDDDVWVHCESGYRAAVAVGFLERQGKNVTVVADSFSQNRRVLVSG
jgi:glyoxylase-like metal-dependent hydrolase (beta-lactamase superfamily II)/rhodanese-related sulfurtransferase